MKTNNNDIRAVFEEARKLYPGIKRGTQIEWDNFQKVCKKHKLKLTEIVTMLSPAIKKQQEHKRREMIKSGWSAAWKHFQTWINQMWWEAEMPVFNPCIICGSEGVKYQEKGQRGEKVWYCEEHRPKPATTSFCTLKSAPEPNKLRGALQRDEINKLREK